MALPLGTPELMSIAATLGWASGLRLYAVLFCTGLAGYLGWIPLPGGLLWLQQPVVLGASGLMLSAEFFADKIPGFDSFWDLLHTFVRIPAGAALAAAVNTSPEPFSNWGLSLAGDAAVPAMLWLSWVQPLWAAVGLGVAVVVMLGLTFWLLRHVRALLRGLVQRFSGASTAPD